MLTGHEGSKIQKKKHDFKDETFSSGLKEL